MGRRIIFGFINAVVVLLMVLFLVNGCEQSILRDVVRSIVMGPEIVVKQGGADIPANSDFNVGSTGSNLDTTFVIENEGLEILMLTGDPTVDLTGADADALAFIVESQPGIDAIDPGDTVDFIIRLSASAILGTGVRTAVVHIPNNDHDEVSFSFSVTGTDSC